MPNSDAIYHGLFSHPLMVEQLVREFVPEAMAAGLDFSRMERVNAKAHGRSLDGETHRREGDVIWRLPTHGGLDFYLYLLLEFQSDVNWWMAVRTQVYQGLLWQQVIAERKLKRGDKLPPVLLLVLYNGETRWNAPTDTTSLIGLPPESPLWPWQPQIRYHVLDMGATALGDGPDQDNLALLLFKLERPHLPDALTPLIDEVIAWFRRRPDHEELKLLFSDLVRQALTSLGLPVTEAHTLPEMKTMLATLGETWKREWLAEGEAKGEAKALILLVEKRFGPLSETLRARIQAADAATIEVWIDRFLDATSLETLFGTQSDA